MTFTFDIKDTRKAGADIIEADKLGADFTSTEVGAFAEAYTFSGNASARYDYLISSNETALGKPYTPSMLVSPTANNVMLGKSTSNKQDWAKLQNLARAIYWTAEQKQWWKDTEGTDDKAVKKERSELSTKASNLITKTWHSGILNAHKRANPDLYKRSASTTKDVQTKVVEGLDDMIRMVRDIKDNDESIYDAGELIVALQDAKKEANRAG